MLPDIGRGADSELPRSRRVKITTLSLLGVLSRHKHIEILVALSLGHLTVTDLALLLELDKTDVSKNLRVLRDYGLVTEQREKKEHHQSLAGSVRVRIAGNKLVLRVHPGRGEKIAMAIEIDLQMARLIAELRRDSPRDRSHPSPMLS